MKIVSVNVSLPEEISLNGQIVLTGIYKKPVGGPVPLGKLGLQGDGQADLTVHGGEFQALYGYPIEHYASWERELDHGSLSYGFFGENLTTSGLLEAEVCVGDVYRVGTAEIQATMHRLPCFKFAHKMGRPDLLKAFLWSGQSGIYFKVVKTGAISAGDAIIPIYSNPEQISIRRLLGLHRLNDFDPVTARRALGISVLPPPLREDFDQKLGAAAT